MLLYNRTMTINQLEYFLVCARRASLTKAAEELYTTQPHVSMVIKSLEKELGVVLFNRTARGVELTREGRRIYPYAANALKNTRLIFSACQEGGQKSLRIATNPSSHMTALLAEHYRKYQTDDYFLQYTECTIEDMLTLVADQEYDLGFLFVPEHKKPALFQMLKRRRLGFTPLCTADLVLYVGPEHPLYKTAFVTPDTLSDLHFIQLEDDFFAVEDLLQGIPFRQVVKTNSSHMMIHMLEHTDLCNLGSFWLRDMFRQHDFGRITVKGFEGQVSFGYVRRCTQPLSAQERAFLEFLQRAIRQDGAADP